MPIAVLRASDDSAARRGVARRQLVPPHEPCPVGCPGPGAAESPARRLDLDVIQLHRRAEAWDIQLLRDAGYEVWALAGGAEADGLMFDSSHGDGETRFRRGPWKTILAGGISKDNLASALVFNPDVVDVSGSLETEPGRKSVELLREFFAEWKAR